MKTNLTKLRELMTGKSLYVRVGVVRFKITRASLETSAKGRNLIFTVAIEGNYLYIEDTEAMPSAEYNTKLPPFLYGGGIETPLPA